MDSIALWCSHRRCSRLAAAGLAAGHSRPASGAGSRSGCLLLVAAAGLVAAFAELRRRTTPASRRWCVAVACSPRSPAAGCSRPRSSRLVDRDSAAHADSVDQAGERAARRRLDRRPGAAGGLRHPGRRLARGPGRRAGPQGPGPLPRAAQQETPGTAERFIIGTFTSVLWAVACAGAAITDGLRPHGGPDVTSSSAMTASRVRPQRPGGRRHRRRQPATAWRVGMPCRPPGSGGSGAAVVLGATSGRVHDRATGELAADGIDAFATSSAGPGPTSPPRGVVLLAPSTRRAGRRAVERTRRELELRLDRAEDDLHAARSAECLADALGAGVGRRRWRPGRRSPPASNHRQRAFQRSDRVRRPAAPSRRRPRRRRSRAHG